MTTVISVEGSGGHRRCDARCHKARPGTPCGCVCQGRNHGVGLARALQNNAARFGPLKRALEQNGWKIKYPDGQGDLLAGVKEAGDV